MTPSSAPDQEQDAIQEAAGVGQTLFSTLQLRKDTAMPLYLQLEKQIGEMIEQGRIPDGETLPAERQMAEALGVSRATVQQSYNGLRVRKLIRGRGRHGSIVQSNQVRLSPGMDRLKSFTQEMHELGRQPSTRILQHEIVTDRSMASLFGLHSGAKFLRLMRVRLGDDVPLSLESAWYSLEAVPELADFDPEGSIYAQLSQRGHSLAYCDQAIEATMPTAFECEIFGFDAPVPCLLIKRRSHLPNGTMAEYVEGMFRGDAYTYRLRLEA